MAVMWQLAAASQGLLCM